MNEFYTVKGVTWKLSRGTGLLTAHNSFRLDIFIFLNCSLIWLSIEVIQNISFQSWSLGPTFTAICLKIVFARSTPHPNDCINPPEYHQVLQKPLITHSVLWQQGSTWTCVTVDFKGQNLTLNSLLLVLLRTLCQHCKIYF